MSSLVVPGELSSGMASSLLGLELAEDGPGEERCLGLLSCAWMLIFFLKKLYLIVVYYQVLDVIRLCDWLVIFTVLAGNISYQVMLLSVTSDSGSLSWAAVDGSLITFSWTCKILDQVL